MQGKSELRKELIERRKSIFSLAASTQIECAALTLCRDFYSVIFTRPKVCCYVSFGAEVPTHNLIKELFPFCDVYLPFFQINAPQITRRLIRADKPFCANKYGNVDEELMEDIGAKAVKDFDFIFTPMLGFNERLFRIGYGIGWYDKFFMSAKGRKVGLAFSGQAVDFDEGIYDVPLDSIITESAIYKNGKN